MMTYFLHGNIIAAGEKRDIDIFASTTQKRGIVLKTTSTGDEIWLKKYTLAQDTLVNHEIGNIRTTTDGGFICAGVVYSSGINTQDMWLLKLESNGYAVTTCTHTTDIKSNYHQDESQLTIAPNPFTNQSVIKYKPVNDNAQLKIYNLMGKQLLTEKITQTITAIDLTNQPSGIYLL